MFVHEKSPSTDSPLHSSSSSSDDDFASFLDAELEDEGEEEEEEMEIGRIKRRKTEEVLEGVKDNKGLEPASVVVEDGKICAHPGFIRGLCIVCGDKAADYGGTTAVALKYIHKDLRLGNDEIARLRSRDLKNSLRHRKLYLVLDLDHTLLNSTALRDMTPDEEYLKSRTDSLLDVPRVGSLFELGSIDTMTKLRPFVRTFLKEASELFEMYIYTMSKRPYALAMADLLDPGKVYFGSRVIAQDDCTERHQKGLDVVLGQESAVLILDDTEPVWAKHRENLILMERYHFFASSCRQFGFTNCKSLSELRSDESETDGALAYILKVLKQIHSKFFDSAEPGVDIADRDVRQVVKTVRKEVLRGCKIVFSRVFPTKSQADEHYLWKMAEQLGATCSTEVDPSVTHVVSTDTGTEKSRWAVREKKFLVTQGWIEAANYFWQRQPEEKYSVTEMKTR